MTTEQIIQLAMQGGFPAAVCWFLLAKLGPLVSRLTEALVRVEKVLDRVAPDKPEAVPSVTSEVTTAPLRLERQKLG